MRCVIVKNIGNRRLFWGETGTGLDWMDSIQSVWIYDTRNQAEKVFKAAKLRHQRAHIIPYDTAKNLRHDT